MELDIAVSLKRETPLAPPRRDFVVWGDEDLSIRFTLYARDDGSDARVSLVGARSRFWVAKDKPWRLWRPVTVEDYAAGVMGVHLEAGALGRMAGPHLWGLSVELPGGRVAAVGGTCLIEAPREVPSLTLGPIETQP